MCIRDRAWWELCLYDVQGAAVLGADRSLLASGRLDNQLSCWAGAQALRAASPAGQVAVVVMNDHEEVGSSSTTGASGPFLESVLSRLVAGRGGTVDDRHRAFAASSCVSADNAHAVHPNYPERHEPGHQPIVNAGPALKVNSTQRDATSATTAAAFQRSCDAADVPWQVFVSRNNMPCGSTIGPLTATRLGIEPVDVGVPQLSMHSARELCGAQDPLYLTRAMQAYLTGCPDVAGRAQPACARASSKRRWSSTDSSSVAALTAARCTRRGDVSDAPPSSPASSTWMGAPMTTHTLRGWIILA